VKVGEIFSVAGVYAVNPRFSARPSPRDKVSSIARLIGLGDDVRIQDPTIQKTASQHPRWYIRPWVERADGSKAQDRFYLGRCDEISKRDATKAKRAIMDKINRRQLLIAVQVPFGEFIDEWLKAYVRVPGNLSSATVEKYESQIGYRIRPEFGRLCMGEITTQRIDGWLARLADEGLSYNSRKDMRNTLSGIFTRARKWGAWKEPNPVMDSTAGRARDKREKRKLTIDQLATLLGALPAPLDLICKLALLTLRISEVLALQEKHLDFSCNSILVRQRYYLEDIDVCKSTKGRRDVPMGDLAPELRALCTGNRERRLFDGWTYNRGAAILRETAKAQGIYWEGFGFHQFRREAKTALGAAGLDPFQLMRLSGHAHADESLLYTLQDGVQQDRAVREFQAKVKEAGK
jgi:integrase